MLKIGDKDEVALADIICSTATVWKQIGLIVFLNSYREWLRRGGR